MSTARAGVGRTRIFATIVATCLVASLLAFMPAKPASGAVLPRCTDFPSVLPIASGGYTTFAMDRNGSLWGQGQNGSGQIGNGSTTDVTTPLNASGFNSLQAVAGGVLTTFVLRQDGTVWAWGNGEGGQLGDGQTGANHKQTTPVPVPGLDNVIALEAHASDHPFAIKGDGTVWAWGNNNSGVFGDGTNQSSAVPKQLPALTGFKAIATSLQFTLGLKSDGTVWAWGWNTYGQLGSSVPNFSNQYTPVQVPGISNVTAIAAGGDHAVALKSDGTVWSWGWGQSGQLGNGSFTMSQPTPVQAATQTGPLTGVVQISAGSQSTVAVKSDGTVHSWGSNLYGELGNPAAADYQSRPIQVSTLSGAKVAHFGWGSAVALTSNGAVSTWGANFYGEIGNGTANNVSPYNNAVRSPYQTSVTQSVPDVPTELSAAAGSDLAYLTWKAPISTITQYVIRTYLNGVAQPEVAAPAGSTSYTVPGLVKGGNYRFELAAQNCLGTGQATPKSNNVVPTGVQLNDSDASSETSRLTDRMSMDVNTFSGNLSVANRDLAIKGTGLDLDVSRTYNNRANTTSIFGNNWSVSGGTDVRLSVQGDGSVLLAQPGGTEAGFAKKDDGTFTSPSGIDATLTKNGDNTYTLSYHFSGEKWRFSSGGTLTSRTDRNVNAITYAYGGPAGALSAITDTQNRVTSLAYNAANLVATVTDPASRVHQFVYDAAKNLTTYTAPGGAVTQYVYDAGKNLTQITTPAGRRVNFAYDASKRVTSISRPLQAGNPTTTFTYTLTPATAYTPAISKTVVTDANGRPTTYEFDDVGRSTKVLDALNNKASATYTSNSNVSSVQSGNGSAGASYGYDSRNNLTRAEVAPGAQSTLGYADASNPFSPTSVTDPQNNTTNYGYDAKGNTVSETTPLATQNQLQLTRNANGTVATSTDPKGNQTNYGYNAAGNLTSVVPPAPLGSQSIAYDSLSRPTSVTDGKGQVTTHVYDALDRVTRTTYQDGKSVNRTYDADGNLTCMTDAAVGTTCTGATTTMAYDAMGRLTQRVTPGGPTVSYAYDGVGNLLGLTDSGGTTSYVYNAVNQPVTVTAPGTGAITLGYDANYNRTSVAYPNGVTVYSTYDSANRVVKVNTVRGAATVNDLNYSLKPATPAKGSARPITMRGSPSTYATNGSSSSAVTLATPSGVVAGDVEVAQISVPGNTTVTSVPAGWTQVRQDASGSTGNDLRQTIYYHVAGSSEPLRYTWGLSQATSANGGLSAWTGVDISSPIETSSGRAITVNPSYASTIGVDNPTGYWRLGESPGATTAADSSPNAMNGTYQGAVTLGQVGAVPGDANPAAALSGGHVTTPLVQSNVTAYTAEAWIKSTDTNKERVIIQDRGAGSGKSLTLSMGGSHQGGPGTAGDIAFGLDSDNVYIGVYSSKTVNDGNWHHVVGTWAAPAGTPVTTSQFSIYIDGVPVSTSPATYAPIATSPLTGSGGTKIGRHDVWGTSFNGSIDEVAVYSSALSASRVAAHYQASYATTVRADTPAGYWRLGESPGASTASDFSPNAMNGTYQGGLTLGQGGALTGDANSAATFSGGHVSTPLLQSGVTAYSAEAWIKSTDGGSHRPIVQARGSGTGKSLTLSMGGSYPSGPGSPGDLAFGVDSDGLYAGVYTTGAFNDGQWHHVVGVWSAPSGTAVSPSQFSLYVDGQAAAVLPVSVGGSATSPLTGSGGTKIGRHDVWGTTFNGTIDEVAIYPSALSAARVAAHFQASGVTANPQNWTAPSVAHQNGGRDLAFYGGRLFGGPSSINVPPNFSETYDTETSWITNSLATRSLPALAGNTGDLTVTGPASWWVAQQVLLRPQYDTALRQTGPGGTNTYDALNRLTGSGGHAYTYDGASNRLTQTFNGQTLSYTYNGANQLVSTNRPISFVGTATGSTPGGSSLNVGLPPGVLPGDQILAAVTAGGSDSASAAGYTEAANVVSGLNPSITLLGTSSGQSLPGSSSYNVSLPGGIQAKDQILVAVTHAANEASSVGGYQTALGSSSGTDATHARTVLYRRTATGGESVATVTVPVTGSSAAVAAVYRGVDPANPIDVSSTGSTPSGTVLTVPSVTPSRPNERLLVVQGATNSSLPGTWTPPAGLTERVQNTAQALRSVGIADAALATTAATGQLSSTIASGNAPLAGMAVTLRPESAARTLVLRRTAQAGDVQVPITLSSGSVASAVVAVYRGVNGSGPIDQLTTAVSTGGNTLSFSSLTPATVGQQLVVFQGGVNTGTPGTWTAPSTTTQRAQRAEGQLRSSGIADKALGSGSTGGLTTTLATGQPSWANLAGVALTLRSDATYSHDANGNLTANAGGPVVYDAADRTTSYTPSGGSASTFTYRGSNQAERVTVSPATRVSAACTDIAGCAPATANLGASASFIHSRLGVVGETIGSSTTYFVRDPNGGLLASRPPTGGPHYYLFDAQSSIVGLTDPAGATAATYGYDPFGRLTSLTQTGSVGTNNPWRYVGAYQDGTGLYKMGHRYYDPSLGRFTQQDPIYDSLDPKSWNRYVYVGGDPLNFTDRTGLSGWLDNLKCLGNQLAPWSDFNFGFSTAVTGGLAAASLPMANGASGTAIAMAGGAAGVAAGGMMVVAGAGLAGYATHKVWRGCDEEAQSKRFANPQGNGIGAS